MRILCIILAFAFSLAGPSLADSADAGLPGPGGFAYRGSPVDPAASQLLVAIAH